MKKNYERPAVLVTSVELGVFGQYGLTDKDENHGLTTSSSRFIG